MELKSSWLGSNCTPATVRGSISIKINMRYLFQAESQV